MPQIVLDPTKPEPITEEWVPDCPLSRRVRSFGYFPDVNPNPQKFPTFPAWLPGDLLLVSAVKPKYLSRFIQGVQQKSYGEEHARWHHAAVYIGYRHICEAVFSGVRVRPLELYVGTHLLRVRRDPQLTRDPCKTRSIAIAGRALTYLKSRYSWGHALSVVLQSHLGFLQLHLGSRNPRTPGAVICAQLYRDSYEWHGARDRVLIKEGFPTPAALSATDRLDDVAIAWSTLPKEQPKPASAQPSTAAASGPTSGSSTAPGP